MSVIEHRLEHYRHRSQYSHSRLVRTEAHRVVPEACFFLQASLCLQGEAAQGAVTTKGEGAIAILTEPSERYQASYLEALQDFQAHGSHLKPSLKEITADFARFVQH